MSAQRALGAVRRGHHSASRNRAKISNGTVRGRSLRKLRVESLESRRLLSVAPWVPGPSLPTATTAAAALTYGTAVDLFGGFHGTQATSAVLQLNYGATAWTTTTSLNSSRAAGGVGETGYYPPNNGDSTTDVFNFGGVSGGQSTASVSNYTGESTFKPMSAARSYFAYVVAPGNTGASTAEYLYAIGGLNGSNQALSSVERYDSIANTWTTMSPLPLPADQGLSHTTAAYDGAGHIFVFGGENSSGAPVNTVYRYTIATDGWDTATPMPTPTSDASALYAAYGQIYLIGGRTVRGGATTVLNTVWNFDPVLTTVLDGNSMPGVWTADTSLPSAVYDAATAIDANGNINVIGGTNSSGAAVINVWTTPVDPPPQGLPAYPSLTVEQSGTYYNADTFSYDGMVHPGIAFAYGTDGVTPVDGTFSFLYNGSPTPPVNAGTYQLLVHFTSSDPGYTDAYLVDQLEIDPAIPTINVTGAGTFLYDGQAHPISATEVGIDGVTPVSGNFTYSYTNTSTSTTSSTPPQAPGTYNAVATFNSSDPNYYSSSDPVPGSGQTVTVTIPDPTIPTGVTVTPLSTSSLQLTWNAAWEADTNLTPANSYNIYERLWHPGTHDPRGSGGTPGYYYYVTVATGVTGTSYTISGLSAASHSAGAHTYAVTSVSPTSVESAKSAFVTGQPKYAPSFAYALVGGALVSSDTVEVGQTANVTMQFYGNEPPTITMLSGPPTMSINPSTGVITYTPAASEYGLGPVTATFQAVNSTGTATASFTFNIIARPTLVVSGGTFTFDGNTHAATAVAYGVDGVTPVPGAYYFTYSPVQYPTAQSTAPYAEVGKYIVTATFYSSDPNYGGATSTGTPLDIVPATPTIVIDSTYGSTGNPQPATATAYGVDSVTPVNGTFSFTYNGSTTPPTAPGIYSVAANFTPTPNPYVAWLDYTNATATGTMIILPNGAVTIQSGEVQGGIQGLLAVIKTGFGTATLDGPNSYTGGTYVTGGTLIVTDPMALPGGGALFIGSDAAFQPAPAPIAGAVAASVAAVPSNPPPSGGTTSSAPMITAPTSTGPTTTQVDVSVQDQALLLHLSINNRSAVSLIFPLASSESLNGPSSDGSSNRDHDIALLLHMSMAN
jgi:autotransporter-associated beta strand protein